MSRLTVSVRAKEAPVRVQARGRGRAFADSPATAESESERENLPDELEPGVTYRDIAVRWRVAARLNEPDWDEAVSGDRRTRRLPRNAPRREL